METPEPELDLAFAYVRDHWAELTRPGEWLAFPLPHPYVRPGGFFKMFVYWDSYFTILGLVTQGRWELAAGIVENMMYAVERLGHVPGYISSRTLCRSRSQPPFLTSAIGEVAPFVADRPGGAAWLARAASAAEREYTGYWTAPPHLTELGLSRYIDPGGDGCVTVPDTPHHRAMAESGWDNTPRFGDDTTMVVPVDLNAQLYAYERDLAGLWDDLDEPGRARAWRWRAEARRELVDRHLWDPGEGCYRDLDLRTGRPPREAPRALSSYVPLWAGLADAEQAARMAAHLPLFEQPHGLAGCEPGHPDGTEHNYPTGWAYSHWYVAEGLRRYGHHEHATRVALKWLRLVAGAFHERQEFFERYNVVEPGGPTPGRYRPQPGFGWTNAVYVALLVRIVLGIRPGDRSPAPPAVWHGRPVRVCLPDYPWPDGTCRRAS